MGWIWFGGTLDGLDWTGSKTRSLPTAEIARDAIQGQSRSFVVVPIDAAYITSY